MDKSVVNSERNIIVCVIYKPPNTDILVFIELFNDILDIIKREDKLCYILGDFNINILNYDTHSATAQFMDTLYENAFFRSLIALHGSRPHLQLWLIIYSPTICIHMSMFYKGFLLRIFLIISPCSISIICTKEKKSNHIPVRETTHFATNRISVLHLLKLTGMSYTRHATPSRHSQCSTQFFWNFIMNIFPKEEWKPNIIIANLGFQRALNCLYVPRINYISHMLS